MPIIQAIENSSVFTACDSCLIKGKRFSLFLKSGLINLSLKDVIFINSMSNYRIQKSKTYDGTDFFTISSFLTIFDGNASSNYVLNSYSNGKISKFDINWNFLKYHYVFYPNFMLGINDSFTFKIFVTTKYGIYSFDKNLRFLKLYSNVIPVQTIKECITTVRLIICLFVAVIAKELMFLIIH